MPTHWRPWRFILRKKPASHPNLRRNCTRSAKQRSLVGIYWEQNAASERDCFSFLIDERTLLSRPEKQMYFSYRYQGGDGRPIFRKNAAVEPEKARACLSSIAKELRVLRSSGLSSWRTSCKTRRTAASPPHGLDGDTSFINRYDAQAAQVVYESAGGIRRGDRWLWVFSMPCAGEQLEVHVVRNAEQQ